MLYLNKILFEKIPNQSKANSEITIWIIRGCVKIITRQRGIKMLRFKINSSSLNSSIDEKIKIWEIPDFFFFLNKELSNHRIIIICIVLCKIIKHYTCLQIQGFLEKIISEINRVSSNNFRHIQN